MASLLNDNNNTDPASSNSNMALTNLEMHNIGRQNGIPVVPEGKKKRKKKKATKQFKKKPKPQPPPKRQKKGKKPGKSKQKKQGDADIPISTFPMGAKMEKIRNAHPRHIVKLVLAKLCQKPSFYRMLGSLGVALKASGIDLAEFFLSSSNKLPQKLRQELRYDIYDQRVLILARLAVHKLLMREGTKLKSHIIENGTYAEDEDPDLNDPELLQLPKEYQSMKKGLKYISNDKFAEKMQTEDPESYVFLNYIYFVYIVCIYFLSLHRYSKWIIF